MTVATGTVIFAQGKAPVIGYGIAWSNEDLEAALKGPVAEIVFDDEGKTHLRGLLEGVHTTEFDVSEVRRILDSTCELENWRVGEALAESYLVYHRVCTFPWPDGRDERKSGSSLPGADLVGFQLEGETDRFVFGEVKTSSEGTYPPGLMHGRTGLKQQLEDLRDNISIRDNLVKYIWYRAVNASWKSRFIDAYIRYNANCNDVGLFGVLVRDIPPHENDIKTRVKKLRKDCPTPTSIELLAIYLPLKSINELGKKIMNMRKGGPA